jgi:hypothetical protein
MDVASMDADVEHVPAWLLKSPITKSVEASRNTQTLPSHELDIPYPWFGDGLKRIAFLGTLDNSWHYGATEAPNRLSTDIASALLHKLALISLAPQEIDASTDGGICVAFYIDGKRANIECFNTGEICAATVIDGELPKVWEISQQSLSAAIGEICAFLSV